MSRVTDSNSVPPPEKDLPPTQITVSKGFAERVGDDGVQRWAAIVQGVVHEAHGRTPDEALLRATEGTDGANAATVRRTRRRADLVVAVD